MHKEDFPFFADSGMIYLDSAASAQKPACVLEAMDAFYRADYANVHRGQCSPSRKATQLYEEARQKVASFVGLTPEQIVFTKGATEGINLVAGSLPQTLTKGDEVLISIAEHHANFVPWQQACLRTGATLKVVDILPSGQLDLADFRKKLGKHTRFVALTHLSNVLGVVNPIEQLTALAHQAGAQVLVDGAQSITHLPTNVAALGCDFFVFSGHKLYGPTGIGVLCGAAKALESLAPCQFGGDMVREVSVVQTTFADVPARLEAGTPPFVEAIGLGAAVDYLQRLTMKKVLEHTRLLTQEAVKQLSVFPQLEYIGSDTAEKLGILAFNMGEIHPSDISSILAQENICVRAGHHCAMPIHHFFNRTGSLRISFGLYNTTEDIAAFVKALEKARLFF